MATVIHDHTDAPEVIHEHHDTTDGNAIGSTVALIVGILVVLLVLFYAIPYLRNMGSGGTNINVPDRIDVNVNPGSGVGTP